MRIPDGFRAESVGIPEGFREPRARLLNATLRNAKCVPHPSASVTGPREAAPTMDGGGSCQ